MADCEPSRCSIPRHPHPHPDTRARTAFFPHPHSSRAWASDCSRAWPNASTSKASPCLVHLVSVFTDLVNHLAPSSSPTTTADPTCWSPQPHCLASLCAVAETSSGLLPLLARSTRTPLPTHAHAHARTCTPAPRLPQHPGRTLLAPRAHAAVRTQSRPQSNLSLFVALQFGFRSAGLDVCSSAEPICY